MIMYTDKLSMCNGDCHQSPNGENLDIFTRRFPNICDQICENRLLPVIIDFVLEAKINTKPTFG